MGIKDRLARLEGGRGCMVCGWPPDEYEVVWDDPNEGAEPDKTERCRECGRALEYVVRWGEANGA